MTSDASHNPLRSAADDDELKDTLHEGEQNESYTSYFIASTEQMIIMFGLYVFSIGPMYWTWLRAKHVDGSQYIAAFYEPLWFLGGLFPRFGEWLNWYVRLWIF